MPNAPHTTCGICDRAMEKAQAVVDGTALCSTCYKRETYRSSCPGCGTGIRVLKGQEPHQCKTCRLKDRQCAGCHKPLLQASIVIGDKAYCYPCSRKLKEPQPCQLCGTLSLFLGRNLKLDITVPACPKCRSKHHKICAECGKSREQAGTNDQGKPLCAGCLARGGPFICPVCKQPGQKHSNAQCRKCYNKALFVKAFLKREPELTQEWVKTLYRSFIDYSASNKAVDQIPDFVTRYLGFFKRIDQKLTQRTDITLFILFQMFGSQWESQFIVACSFLVHSKLIPDLADDAHKEMSNFFKLQAIIDQAVGKWFYPVLVEFYQHQQELLQRYRSRGWLGKNLRYRQTTIKAALRAALKFLGSIETGPEEVSAITQIQMNKFVFENPGYLRAIRTFIRFLKIKKKTFQKISLKSVQPSVSDKNEVPAQKYEELLTTWFNPAPEKAKYCVIGLFSLLYAQRPKAITRILLTDVLKEDDGYAVKFNGVAIPLDEGTSAVLAQYLAERKGPTRNEPEGSRYLFPGKVCSSPMSENSVHSILRGQGTSTRQVFPTALLQVFRAGVQHPYIVKAAYGMCSATASKYFELSDGRLRNEINEIRNSH
jgi:hypothetical protein